ncbi:Na/Pi cotransporter family protein [Desulfofalx alkaliphila]|uniref:Na/Pi cotransporter family protein n=1 Tax=Desulfofalx alkaliphila TaxID=105483 RepID=UPI0004E0F305|nr:Na/Pi cotransporter family protein [Desulfofalx alkaliphila]
MWLEATLGLMGGMGLLLYGMYIMSEGLQKIAGQKLRTVMSTLTQNRFIGLLVGAVVTVILQSSTATTVILVGLTSASIITLRQTLAVILGADIGTTITAQLIALKVTEIALPIVGIGATIIFFGKTGKYKRIGQAITGFGLLFLGLKIMSDVMYPLRDDPFFTNALMQISDRPVLAILLAAIFTFLVHSSAATIGIIMLLAMQGLVPLVSAVFLLFGANIGTSFTALISSLGSTREAQRVATAHLLFKLVGVLIFLPFVSPFANLVTWITPNSPGFQVANVHTIFNVAIALMFLPFTAQFAKFLEYIIPEKDMTVKEFKPRYLDDTLISSPSIAIGLATKEIIRVSDNVTEMVRKCDQLFKEYNPEMVEELLNKEEKVDQLSENINKYLTKIMRQSISRDDFNRCMGLVHIVKDYEHIGDVIEKNIVYLAESKYANNADFTPEGHREITVMLQRIIELMTVVNTAFVSNSCYMAEKAKMMQDDIIDLEFRLRMSHFARMQKGGKEVENTSSIFLDIINSYLRIGEHLSNIAMALTDEVSCTWHAEVELIYGPDNSIETGGLTK